MSSFSVYHWLIVGLFVYVLAKVIGGLRGRGSGPPRVCTTCGHHGVPVRTTRGSFPIEVVLWLCFIVPGLIYSLWRISTRTQACAACGATTLVPDDSPVGRKLLADRA